MNFLIDQIEEDGLQPLKDILQEMGGWPVVEGDTWNEEEFSWTENIYKNRRLGYSIDYIVDFSVTVNVKNSTYRIIDVSILQLFIRGGECVMSTHIRSVLLSVLGVLFFI